MQSHGLIEVARRAPFSALFGIVCSCRELASTPVDREKYVQQVRIGDMALRQYPNGYRVAACSEAMPLTTIKYVNNAPTEITTSSPSLIHSRFLDTKCEVTYINGVGLSLKVHGVTAQIHYYSKSCYLSFDYGGDDDQITEQRLYDLLSNDPTAIRAACDIIEEIADGESHLELEGIHSSLL